MQAKLTKNKTSKGKSTPYLSIMPTTFSLRYSGEKNSNKHQKEINPMQFIGHRLHHRMNLGAAANWISM